MVQIITQCYWMMSVVLTTLTSIYYNVLILHTLIVDVITLTIMMQLYIVVSLIIVFAPKFINSWVDHIRIWDSYHYVGMIRLQKGRYSNQGRVEVYCNGQWGTICNDGFDFKDAYTVCRQLGYTGYVNYNHLIL